MPEQIPTNRNIGLPTSRSALERRGQPPETPEQQAERVAATPFERMQADDQKFFMFATPEELRALAIAAGEQGNVGMLAAAGGAAAVRLAEAKSTSEHENAHHLQELIFDTQRLFAEAQNPGQQG